MCIGGGEMGTSLQEADLLRGVIVVPNLSGNPV